MQACSYLTICQVTASEALPREEVQQTPYGVLCTTPGGGHLSWFELGGRRWFERVVGILKVQSVSSDVLTRF